MPGEHWCTHCQKDKKKYKEKYIKLYWLNYKWPINREGKIKHELAKEVISIICEKCYLQDIALKKWLFDLFGFVKPADHSLAARDRSCVICNKKIKKTQQALELEFYNYRGAKTEDYAFICQKCINKNKALAKQIPTFRLTGRNPTFRPVISCSSSTVCGFFKPPTKDRGINCQNIVVNMQGELYCRRGHPGRVKVYSEKNAVAPSMRQALDMYRMMQKSFKPFMDQIKQLDDPEVITRLLQGKTATPIESKSIGIHDDFPMYIIKEE